MAAVFAKPKFAPVKQVQPKPVVRPSKPVAAGQREGEERAATKRVRTGMGTQARSPSVLGKADLINMFTRPRQFLENDAKKYLG